MATDKSATSSAVNGAENGSPGSPATSNLKQRGLQRASTLNEPANNTIRRRSSFFSDTFSDTHKSFRSSTDDLLLPRVKTERFPVSAGTGQPDSDEVPPTTHWHSLPLGLALLPALAGVFFQNGSAIITDITLLGLAAIFLNWSLRLPWEWYHAAQASNIEKSDQYVSHASSSAPLMEEEDEDGEDISDQAPLADKTSASTHVDHEQESAQRELRLYEMLALLSCFLTPGLGAWLLHTLRDQLSRPSEGLVSNYNLTIFLLVAELRPLSHLVKMVQRRTLYLQKRVSAIPSQEGEENHDKQIIADLDSRLEELEAHIADSAAKSASNSPGILPESVDALVRKASSQANADWRKTMQPELDALNRAMRRYEKRMTISAIQVEARLQDLENRLKDVVVLAAAAQRSVNDQPQRSIVTLTNWLCALVVVPTRFAVEILKIPGRFVQAILDLIKRTLNIGPRSRFPVKQGVVRPRATYTKDVKNNKVKNSRPVDIS